MSGGGAGRGRERVGSEHLEVGGALISEDKESRGGTRSNSDGCPHARVVWTVSEEKCELFY